MFNKYLQIIKPKIILGNQISLISGFLLAAKGNINYILFLFTLIGLSLIIASSCVLNNYIDRDIDIKMERTKDRPSVKGTISPISSLIYAYLLGFTGFFLLWFGTNQLVFFLGLSGFIIYVIIYSLYMKRRSLYSTIVGSLSGAMPPVIGYCSVTNEIDSCALVLLLMFILWQIPHSYSVAIFFLKDYKTANIPVLPVIKGISVTKNHIIFYIVAFSIASLILPLNGFISYKYLIVSLIINAIWLIITIIGYNVLDKKIWAQRTFILSIITIMMLSIMISIDYILNDLNFIFYKNF